MKLGLTLVLLFLFTFSHAQKAFKKFEEEVEVDRLRDELSKNEDIEDDGFAVIRKEVTFEFIKDDNDSLFALEERKYEVLSLRSFGTFKKSILTDENTKLVGIYPANEKFKLGSALPTFTMPYNQSGIFHQDGTLHGMGYPDADREEVIRFVVKLVHRDVRYLTSTYFQEGMFQHLGKVNIVQPDWLDLEIEERHLEAWGIERKDELIDGDSVISFAYVNLEQFDMESGAPGPSYYLPHIRFWFKEAEGAEAELFTDLDQMYSWYKSLVDEVEEDNELLKEQLDEILEGATTDQEKLERIFYWIQYNIRYIAFEDGIAGFQPDAGAEVCENRYGDCKGMANLAKQFYTMAGFDARLTWIGTRRLNYGYSIPSLSADNHMICTVFLNGKRYFIDPTEEYISLGDYAHRIQGRQVLIENGDKYILDTVPEYKATNNLVKSNRFFKLDNNRLVGELDKEFNGESKTRMLRSYNSIEKESRSQALEKYAIDGKRMKVKNIRSSDMNSRNKVLKLSFDFVLDDGVITYGDKLMIDLNHQKNFYYSKLDEDRKCDYHFSYKHAYDETEDFGLPTGYEIEHVPENLEIDNEFYHFSFIYSTNGSRVKLEKKLIIKKGVIPIEKIAQWNADISKLRTRYDDRLILSKNS